MQKNDGHFLSPFDDFDVIEGQASVAVEIEAQLGFCPDHIVMPVGGGGLSAGVLKYFENNSQYSLIEPLGGASLWAALIAGRPVPLIKLTPLRMVLLLDKLEISLSKLLNRLA